MLQSINDIYRFDVHLPSGTVQMKPQNASLEWKWESDKDRVYLQKFLETQLQFVNSPSYSIDDFTELYNIDRDPQLRCTRIYMDVYRDCGGSDVLFWSGHLSMQDGDWDPSNCAVKIKPKPVDDYECYESIKDKEKNILSVQPPAPTYTIEIEKKQCRGSIPPDDGIDYDSYVISDCLPSDWQSKGWVWIENKVVDLLFKIDITTYFERSVYITPCDSGTPVPPTQSPDWVLLEDNCASDGTAKWVNSNKAYGGGAVDRARRLDEILELLLEDCNLTVISNFFSINPDGTNPNNDAYDKAQQHLSDIRIAQITDVMYPAASQPAYIGNMTAEQLIEDLSTMFNLKMAITGGVMYLEHISYFEDNYTFNTNLITGDFKKFSAGRHQYSYDKQKLPRSESFYWGQELRISNYQFRGWPIEYNPDCANTQLGKDEKRKVEYFLSDIDYIARNVEDFREKNRVEGNGGTYPTPHKELDTDLFVIMATDNGVITYGTPPFTVGSEPNWQLAWATLHWYFHRDGRPFELGRMNDQDNVDFVSYNRPRSQSPISFPICCDELMGADLNVDLFKSQMGWGKVSEATYKDPEQILELNLNHR